MHRILVIFAVVPASFAVPVHADRATDSTYFDYVSGAGMSLARIKKNVITTYLHNDHLGSAAVGTGAAGTVWWTERYSPFGELLSGNAANDNLAGYTGHIRDTATGLTYMQARYYDPVVGRFLSIDPVTFLDTGEPGMFGRYTYTFNGPINFADPQGMCPYCISPSGAIAGANNFLYPDVADGAVIDMAGKDTEYILGGGIVKSVVKGVVNKLAKNEAKKQVVKRKIVKSKTKDGKSRIKVKDKDGNTLKDVTEKRVKEYSKKDTPDGPKMQKTKFKDAQPGSKVSVFI